jgi:tripeptide aminopeptidase
MGMVKYLLDHPEVPHGPLRICFNPDEEIGRGMHHIRLEELNAKVAYTLDAEHLGEVNYETFSADQAVIEVKGVASHPGSAKGVMVNALKLAASFLQALPKDLCPEKTSDREGFIHPIDLQGTAEKATIRFILRDFELDELEAKRQMLKEMIENLKKQEPRGVWDIKIVPQYRNMRYWLEKDQFPLEAAKEAMVRAGLKPFFQPIRGGTDGAHLTERGLPTPNIFTGFHNIHSEKEWVSLQDMVFSVTTLVHLVQVWEEQSV